MSSAMSANDKVAVGLVQMKCEPGNKAANLERAEHLLAELAGRVRIACLPEMLEVGYDLGGLGAALFELAEPVPGPTSDRLALLARKLGFAIVGGVTERDPDVADLLYDTAILLDREGELVGRYRKSHLYPTEHTFFRPGSELPVFELAGLRIGIAICFEHAFPQIFTTLARRGARRQSVGGARGLWPPAGSAHPGARPGQSDLRRRGEPRGQGGHGHLLRPQPGGRSARRARGAGAWGRRGSRRRRAGPRDHS